ncbi:unnamed protein product [Mycena citricolor]|uniref:cellulase n=1 Tax=Mycena citricolor TaxID=2018698 RepID=A0AAD2JUQ8_9AGAR|nr:unnamed protein product [Mycena citricolor]CAK5276152.1 unnamed protein product [Mycena citricolor]
MKYLLALASLAVVISPAASVAVYGQCGGIGYTGSTVCDAGSVCTANNSYYSQCLPGTAPPPSSTTSAVVTSPTTPTSTASAPASSGCSGATKFKFFGVNQSGAEFGSGKWPGVYGTDYIFPAPSSIDYFVNKGFNFFRMPFMLERLVPPAGGLTGPFDQTYLGRIQSSVTYITGKGAHVALDPHNYMLYNNQAITDTTHNASLVWKNLATVFKSNPNVIFDVMNEPNGIPASTAFALNQAAIYGIRSSGATSQLILVEGTAWTGGWTWISSGNSAVFGNITDPNHNVAIQMHQYLDSDGSGTNPTCVSPTIGAERLQAATSWLKANNLKGFLGEIGAGNNADCISAVKGAMCAMQQSGVWIGASWWAAGPWWANYFTSIEPPSGASVNQILPQALMPYM